MMLFCIYIILCSADIEVRRKAMSIVLSMTSPQNIEEVVLFLKKQLQKTQEHDYEKEWEVFEVHIW